MTTKNTGHDEELRKSQQRYRTLFENDIVGMYRTRIDGSGVLEVNQALCNILGFTKEEILTNPATIRWADPRARELMVNHLTKYGSVVNYEADILSRSGSIRHTLLSLKIYPQESCIEGILIDITKRKRAEESLYKSEERLTQLYDNMSNCAAVYEAVSGGEDFIIKNFNRAAERLEKVEREDILGKSVKEVFPGVQKLGLLEVFQRVWKTGEPEHHPIRLYEDGRISGWRENFVYKLTSGEIVAIYDDVTERKRVEEELNKYRYHLEELIENRTAELRNAYEKLREENDNRKAVEHELNLRKQELEEMNSALHVLLKQRKDDRANMEMNIISNIKTSVLPYIEKLELSGLAEGQIRITSLMRSLLGEITSPFIRNVSSEFLGFTPHEVQIASLIKEGKSSKEIAEILNISLNTVHTYRYKIRIKTGLKNNKVNLRSYLQTLE